MDRNERDVLLGGTDEIGGLWQWTDGTTWNYDGWGEDEPDGRPGTGDVMYMRKKNSENNGRAWIDGDSGSASSFLCAFDECPPSE